MEQEFEDGLMTPKDLLAMIMAHIEENLLLELNKKTFKNKLFTVIEIREQMQDSMIKLLQALEEGNYDTDGHLPQRNVPSEN
jgi:hypothetical protein